MSQQTQLAETPSTRNPNENVWPLEILMLTCSGFEARWWLEEQPSVFQSRTQCGSCLARKAPENLSYYFTNPEGRWLCLSCANRGARIFVNWKISNPTLV